MIRTENAGNPQERARIRAINQAAFGGPAEADLVDKLRAEGHALLSLVAELLVAGRGKGIVGHILFSRMWIESPAGLASAVALTPAVALAPAVALTPAVALAPVAVLPEQQHRGIGGRLIRHGVGLLRGRGEQIVIVVGHPDYYPRFGFSTEKAGRLESPFPPEVFLGLELTPGALEGIRGKVIYPGPFGL